MSQLNNKETIRIAVVTGSRADYGLLYSVMQAIQSAPWCQLQTVATGMHLSPEFGYTCQTIEADGFAIDARVECLLSGDSAVATAKSMGLGVIGFADTLYSLDPDLLLVLGDRFEIFAAVQAALILNIPVGHIAGGDTTEGAFDESLRHGITKMSHLHFATNAQAARRIMQMGENPAQVFTVGSPGIDLILQTQRLSKTELQSRLGIPPRDKLFLVTFHPTTLEPDGAQRQCQELLNALDRFRHGCNVVISKANADSGGRHINRMMQDYARNHDNASLVASLGQQLYYSAMAAADVVIGNSSSGLYEAPSLKTPTVNIGDRQKGRLRADSVIDCPAIEKDIIQAIETALGMDCSGIDNPYGDGHATKKIMAALRDYADRNKLRSLIKKHFYCFPHEA